MGMKNYQIIISLFFALLFFWFGWNVGKKETTDKPTTDTVIMTYVDTFYFERPTEVIRYITRHDTIVCTDTTIKIVIDTISGDSTAIIPIERAIYQDSTQNAKYTAFLSGFRPVLDSIQIECKQTETIITKIEREKARRIGLGVQMGVGLSPKGVAAPYVGIGVQYRIF